MTLAISDFIVLFLSGCGILLCAVVGVQLLVRQEGVKLTNQLLGCMLLLFASTTFNGLLANTGVLSKFQQLYFLPIVYTLSLGPLFYFFVRSKINPAFRFETRHLVHAILPFAQFAFYCAIGFRSTEFKSWVWREILAPYGQFVEEGLQMFSAFFYLILAYQLLRNLPRELWKAPVYAWLKRFTLFLLVLYSMHASYEVANWIAYEGFGYNLFNHDWITLPLKLADVSLSFFIGYNALIYQGLVFPRVKAPQAIDPNISQQIKAAFEEQQVHLDPELNLDRFARLLGHPKNTISKVLNQEGTTFRTIVNQYRVEEFVDRARSDENDHLSLLGLAFDSGFNSKASFNRVFKELKGQTPSAYLQTQ